MTTTAAHSKISPSSHEVRQIHFLLGCCGFLAVAMGLVKEEVLPLLALITCMGRSTLRGVTTLLDLPIFLFCCVCFSCGSICHRVTIIVVSASFFSK